MSLESTQRVLVADVGGTKTEVALHVRQGEGFVEVASQRLASAEQSGLGPIVQAFLAKNGGPVQAAAAGVAGPVIDGECRATNLPWTLSAAELARASGAARAQLLNDFEASALGLLELPPESKLVLQEGLVDPGGPIALLGAGTGLGEALLVPSAESVRVLPTEGGHTDFAPRNADEDALLAFLRERLGGHVSYERVLSGEGLVAVYEMVVATGRASARVDFAGDSDRAARISEHALAGDDAACVRALAIFVSVYGAEAGNLALKSLPTGGLFVAGGIAPKILPAIREGSFLAAFLDKGRMRRVLERIPVTVVLDARVGLLGARRAALAAMP